MLSLATTQGDLSASGRSRLARVWWRAVLLGLWLGLLCGCTSVLSPISSIPVRRVPAEFVVQPRANWVPVDLARFRQLPPREYLLEAGDVLGIYIEGVLGNQAVVPPVRMPEQGSDLLPGFGYPVPVREDGTLSLPMVAPLAVRGLTVAKVQERIGEIYLQERKILRPDLNRISVTLVRKRTSRVIVVREDGMQDSALPGGRGGRVLAGSAQEGRGFVLNLPAHENDLLHALAQTGGLPGLNAKNEVKILRSTEKDWASYDAFVREFYARHAQNPCACPTPPESAAVLRIPLRLPPGETPRFQPEDIVLRDGDIVCVESRETEVFYTGGLLPAGQFPLPRDYDLDVLAAIAVSGRGLETNIGGSLMGGMGGATPTSLYLIRRAASGDQITIGVDLNRAITDPHERLLVQAGDTLILRHTTLEETENFGLFTFFTYGIQRLFKN